MSSLLLLVVAEQLGAMVIRMGLRNSMAILSSYAQKQIVPIPLSKTVASMRTNQ